jgi:hypothetical protein
MPTLVDVHVFVGPAAKSDRIAKTLVSVSVAGGPTIDVEASPGATAVATVQGNVGDAIHVTAANVDKWGRTSEPATAEAILADPVERPTIQVVISGEREEAAPAEPPAPPAI